VLAVEEGLDECADCLFWQFLALIQWKALTIDGFADRKRWQAIGFEVQIICE